MILIPTFLDQKYQHNMLVYYMLYDDGQKYQF